MPASQPNPPACMAPNLAAPGSDIPPNMCGARPGAAMPGSAFIPPHAASMAGKPGPFCSWGMPGRGEPPNIMSVAHALRCADWEAGLAAAAAAAASKPWPTHGLMDATVVVIGGVEVPPSDTLSRGSADMGELAGLLDAPI